jgi:hypothetical protein
MAIMNQSGDELTMREPLGEIRRSRVRGGN